MCDHGNGNRDEVLDELNKLENLRLIMQYDRKKYFDGCHASPGLYPDLINKILENIN
jgi:hypothetical protein